MLERARAASPERVKRELAAFVAHITAVSPLVIAIDDFHWADASTVEVLAYLLSRPDLKRLLSCVRTGRRRWRCRHIPLSPSVTS